MDLETMLKETYVSQPSMKDMLPFGNLSSHEFFQDFHHTDQFEHVNNVSSSNPIQYSPNFDNAFDNFNFIGSSSPYFDAYECKPFVENNNNIIGGHAHVMDNFLYGNYSLNLPQRNQLDMMVPNQSNFLPINSQEIIKPSNFVVPDEVSRISRANYYKRVGVNKNDKSYPTIRRTYKLRKKSSIVKGQWTIEEDGMLIQLVEQYGLRKWSHIAKILPGRIGKQCRERWHNHLRPDIKKDIWTDEEDKVLIEAHAEVGNKWAEIAKKLPGRTENSIKNHWNATKRRQYSKRKCRSKYPRGTLLQEYIKSLNLDKNPPRDYRKRTPPNYANKTKVTAAPVLPQTTFQFCAASTDDHCLAPNYYDFNVVPGSFFGENLFEEGCYNIDALLDGVPCAPLIMDKKDFEEKLECDPTIIMEGEMMCVPVVDVDENHVETEIMPIFEVEVKKELDLMEMMMMSHIDSEIVHV